MDKVKLAVSGAVALPVFAMTGPIAAVAGGFLAVNLAYNAGATVLRNVRELIDEKDGDCYFVYYPFDNKYVVADFILPEFFVTDVFSGATNIKMKHCAAWFTTSASTYVTIEITSGKNEGVYA